MPNLKESGAFGRTDAAGCDVDPPRGVLCQQFGRNNEGGIHIHPAVLVKIHPRAVTRTPKERQCRFRTT